MCMNMLCRHAMLMRRCIYCGCTEHCDVLCVQYSKPWCSDSMPALAVARGYTTVVIGSEAYCLVSCNGVQ